MLSYNLTFWSQFISNNGNNMPSLELWSDTVRRNGSIQCLPVATMDVNKYWGIYKKKDCILKNVTVECVMISTEIPLGKSSAPKISNFSPSRTP